MLKKLMSVMLRRLSPISARFKRWRNTPQVNDDGYWVYCHRRFEPEPDGRFRFFRRPEEVEQMLPRLRRLIEEGKLFGFKYTLEEFPGKPEVKVRPILVYFTRKTKGRIRETLRTELGVKLAKTLSNNPVLNTGTTFTARKLLEGKKFRSSTSAEKNLES